jgi:hypothetical protein
MERFVAAVARLRGLGASLAPYLVLAVVVPGGTLVAPFLYIHRRRRAART